MDIDLNQLDTNRFEQEDDYQDAARATEAGIAIEVLATSMTLQDCAEFLGVVQPDLLRRFFVWAASNYPELEIPVDDGIRLVEMAVANDELGIVPPGKVE